ncbi:MAG: hypothetical protein ACTSVY_07405 [Candidatus Helarchaeota archaeon]
MSWEDEFEEAQKEAENISRACKLFVRQKVDEKDVEKAYYYCLKKFRDEDEMLDEDDLKKLGLRRK